MSRKKFQCEYCNLLDTWSKPSGMDQSHFLQRTVYQPKIDLVHRKQTRSNNLSRAYSEAAYLSYYVFPCMLSCELFLMSRRTGHYKCHSHNKMQDSIYQIDCYDEILCLFLACCLVHLRMVQYAHNMHRCKHLSIITQFQITDQVQHGLLLNFQPLVKQLGKLLDGRLELNVRAPYP